MEKIGVIVPIYKVEKYIHRCIESVLEQTYSHFELILVDDGSPDACPSICDEYEIKDARVHVIHKVNGGLSSARNAGIEYALQREDIQWLTFIDSDDWVHRQYLEILYEAVLSSKMKISVCDYLCVTDETSCASNVSKVMSIPKVEDFWVKKRMLATIAWGKLYAKELFENIRYPEGKIHEDEYVTYRLLFGQQKVACCSDPLYYYYQREESIVHQRNIRKKLDAYGAFQEQLQFFKEHKFRRAYKGRCIVHVIVLFDLLQKAQELLSQEEYEPILKTLQPILRKNLLKYRRRYAMGKCHEAWLLAFPEKEKQIMRRRNIRIKLKAIIGK